MSRPAKVTAQLLAAVFIFIVGMATGVMLMQVNPRDPNLAQLVSLAKKSGDHSEVHDHPMPECPPAQEAEKK